MIVDAVVIVVVDSVVVVVVVVDIVVDTVVDVVDEIVAAHLVIGVEVVDLNGGDDDEVLT